MVPRNEPTPESTPAPRPSPWKQCCGGAALNSIARIDANGIPPRACSPPWFRLPLSSSAVGLAQGLFLALRSILIRWQGMGACGRMVCVVWEFLAPFWLFRTAVESGSSRSGRRCKWPGPSARGSRSLLCFQIGTPAQSGPKRQNWERIRQGLLGAARLWAGSGQGRGSLWLQFGQTLGELSKESGQVLGRSWARFRQALGRVWAGAAKVLDMVSVDSGEP
jgi:hypothetical protein